MIFRAFRGIKALIDTPRCPVGNRFRLVLLIVPGFLLGSFNPAFGSPFISEIYLPGWGGTAVEIDGIDAAGATLLIVDATPARKFTVRQVHHLTAAALGQTPASTITLAGTGWTDSLPGGVSPGVTVEVGDELFSADKAIALVLLRGQSSIPRLAQLGVGSAIADVDPDASVVDWVGFAPAPAGTDPASMLETLSPTAAAALGVTTLPRPAATTRDVTVLARALTVDGPVLDRLLGGTSLGIDAGGAVGGAVGGAGGGAGVGGYLDFAVSPGITNPATVSTPEPSLLTLGLGLLFIRPRRRPTPFSRGLAC